ncbi:hypothetical protein EYF80_025458 [Liparis tanakae]|uniref:Uncharacterized protein n=1 Tax=Liparis tanakae TaxID=230148 RepID=A0A4Z2HEN5_9TELE|nr:hypothetical protein EYF80_025458 [Liparis tanakae]
MQTCHSQGHWPCLLPGRGGGKGEGEGQNMERWEMRDRASGMEEEEEGRWTATSLLMLLMLLLSSSVDSLRTSVGSFWASQSATLLSDAIIAACSVLKSLPPDPPLPAPLFLERDRWWSGVNFDTWSFMVTFPGEVASNSMICPSPPILSSALRVSTGLAGDSLEEVTPPVALLSPGLWLLPLGDFSVFIGVLAGDLLVAVVAVVSLLDGFLVFTELICPPVLQPDDNEFFSYKPATGLRPHVKVFWEEGSPETLRGTKSSGATSGQTDRQTKGV